MTPARIWLVIQLALLVFIALAFIRDRFAALNAFADDVERKAPLWFRWERWGSPITWVHHALWTAAVGALGGLTTLVLFHDWRPGFQRFALGWVLFYLIREGRGLWKEHRSRPGWWRTRAGWREALWRGGPHVAGWLTDGVMDVVFPALVAWLAYR